MLGRDRRARLRLLIKCSHGRKTVDSSDCELSVPTVSPPWLQLNPLVPSSGMSREKD